jgi:DNA-binding PadR family transcriptional regulator
MKQPLNYAILLYFTNHAEGDADEVMTALASEYSSYRTFKKPAVIEALMTAKENGILDESRVELDGDGELKVWYQLADEGAKLIKRFL